MGKRSVHQARRLVATLLPSFLFAGVFDARGEDPQPRQDTAALDSTSVSLDDVRHLIEDWKYGEAETLARRLLAEAEARHGLRSLQAAEVMDLLVEAIVTQHPPGPEGEEMARRAVAIKDSLLGPEHPGLAVSLRALARVQWASAYAS